ncbi:MAG: hypothetical protein GW859_07080 [Sphingomonadales bacterium]|nr:hypothetical protein [Sphingomonadales bacterium]
MTYSMHNPYGAVDEVDSLEQVDKKVAEFIVVIKHVLGQTNAADNADHVSFGDFDRILGYWNSNVTVVEQLNSDPQILLLKKKEHYQRMAKKVLNIAETYLGESPQPD